MHINLNPISNHAFLDFHTHSLREHDRDDVIEILSIHLGQDKPHDLFTIGMHPWWTDDPITPEQKTRLVSELTKPACLAMGEIGLDNLKGPDMVLQMNILRSLLDVAKETGKPVIIHCVRAFDQLLKIKKEYPSIEKWCVHGYGRHNTLAKQLIDQGFHLSLMPSKDEKYAEWFKSLPMERLFLETDSMPNVRITQVYEQVAEVTGMSLHALKNQMSQNAKEFFRL
ncbi:MAG: hypothetical protein CMB80_28895 [Flammeovirgaceae bacterium]|nr:hypothetical protein [Flammeovirgaceae bacterium]MBE62318.1 hypothetical protein [Flammeovirgaceae bacterium]